MKIIIERKDNCLYIDLGTTDWDLYEVLGMLERAKLTLHSRMDKLNSNGKGESTHE